MKLYVLDKNNQKVYLETEAKSKRELLRHIGSNNFLLGAETYHIDSVKAEASGGRSTAGVIFGGLLGMLGGPIGVILGGSIGGAIGNSNDNDEIEKVNQFNESTL